MSRFGIIEEIAPVRDYSEMIYYSQKIYEMSLELKEIRLIEGPESDSSEKVLAKIEEMNEIS